MRGGGAAALYFIAVGWYIRWSGLDADCARIIRGCWDLTVAHTAHVARRGKVAELADELADDIDAMMYSDTRHAQPAQPAQPPGGAP